MSRSGTVGQSREPQHTEAMEQLVAAASGRRRRLPRWLMWTGAVVLVLAVVAVGVVAYGVHNAEPILRRRVIADLEDRFHSPVELDALHISVLRGLEVSGSGLRILSLAGAARQDIPPRAAPVVSVKSFQFHSGLRALFAPTTRVAAVYVQGMQLNLPPKQDRGTILPNRDTTPSGAQDDPKRPAQPKLAPVVDKLVVDKIVCEDVTLTIETEKPGKVPLVFAIHTLTLTDVGRTQPFAYTAYLRNPKPVGEIHATGHFGPWQDGNPRDSPIDGHYDFSNADLGSIKGIGGTLSSTGQFSGVLGEISVTGSTETPDFFLDVSEHPVPLHTDFDALVDGTTGDTILNSVRATLRHTVLLAKGSVVRVKPGTGVGEVGLPGDSGAQAPGHDIELTVTSDQARVEDLLRLGAKSSPPLMNGAMTLRTQLRILPGPGRVVEKMRLNGSFGLSGVTFNNAKFQEDVDKLSTRAQGHAKEAKAGDVEQVSSEMSGQFALANAVLTLNGLDYRMPGAEVRLEGEYHLQGERFAFAGTARTDATASQMLTGWKSLLARPFDGLLKKNGAGVEVPITVSGTRAEPKFGVDLDKMFSRHKEPAASAPSSAANGGSAQRQDSRP